MIEKPIVHNDEYTHSQERKLKVNNLNHSSSKRSLSVSNRSINMDQSVSNVDGRTGHFFRFMDSKHERI